MKRENALNEARQAIKEANQKIIELEAKLNAIPQNEQRQHPVRFEWIQARSEYWNKIAEMRDIEHGKSVIDKDT